MLFIEYPKCTTCKRAYKYLNDNKLEVKRINIVENIPTKEELSEYIEKSGLEPKKFFNTSGKLYKEMNLKDKVKDMSKEEICELLATNGMLIKRPILVTEDKVLVGFKEENYSELK
ncbi:MAG: arsenate reductase family protein [Clostridium butyricum]|nr:arsenate reductase family protein [Clostridium butyricum]